MTTNAKLQRIALVVAYLLALRVSYLMGGLAHRHPSQGAVGWIGACVFCLGLAIAIWARFYLGRQWGQPMTQRSEPRLITTGPYRYVRHPIYTGLTVALIGTVITVSLAIIIPVGVLVGYFMVAVFAEDRQMHALFGADFEKWRDRTARLIPFVF